MPPLSLNFAFLPRCMQCRRGLAMRILSICPTVSPSVRLSSSVKRVHCDKTQERSVQPFIPYETSFSLVFWEEECLVVGDPFYLKFWIKHWLVSGKNTDHENLSEIKSGFGPDSPCARFIIVQISFCCNDYCWTGLWSCLRFLAAGYRTWPPVLAAARYSQYFRQTRSISNNTTLTRTYSALQSTSLRCAFTIFAVLTWKVLLLLLLLSLP